MNTVIIRGGTRLFGVHYADECVGDHCAIHNVSDHHMRTWPQHYRWDRGIMERTCRHGIGHPDPDDYAITNGRDSGVHGCDGCCTDAYAKSFEGACENAANAVRKLIDVLFTGSILSDPNPFPHLRRLWRWWR